LILRRDCQFHWYNHGYESFDAFLATFTAEKRKKAKRERRRVAEAGIEFDTLHGATWTMRWWDTYIPLCGHVYATVTNPNLNLDFFKSCWPPPCRAS